MPLYLTESDVAELLTPAEAFAAVEASFGGSRAAASTTRLACGARSRTATSPSCPASTTSSASPA